MHKYKRRIKTNTERYRKTAGNSIVKNIQKDFQILCNLLMDFVVTVCYIIIAGGAME